MKKVTSACSSVVTSSTKGTPATTSKTTGSIVSSNSTNALEQLKVDLENITHAQAFASAIVATINQEFFGVNGHAESLLSPNNKDQLDIKQQKAANEVRSLLELFQYLISC